MGKCVKRIQLIGNPAIQTGMDKRSSFVPFFLALCPVLILMYMVMRFPLEAPFRDSWSLVPFLEKMYQGTLVPTDLLAQHAEHRPFFPRVILLSLARLTHWDLFYEAALNFVLAIGIFLNFLFRRSLQEIGRVRLPLWFIPVISAFLFSLVQYENFWVGWQLVLMLNIYAVTWGTIFLCTGKISWLRIGAAAVCGIVATFSHAIGLFFWLVGAGVILLTSELSMRQRGVFLATWMVIFCSIFICYFWGFERTVYPDIPVTKQVAIFSCPVEYGKFLLKYLSSGVSSFSLKGTYVFSLAGLVALPFLVGRWIRQRAFGIKPLLPSIVFCSYSIGAALLTGLNRAGWCSSMALSSRYTSLSLLFWISVCIMFYFTSLTGDRKGWIVSAIRITIIGVTAAVLISSVFGFFEWKAAVTLVKPLQSDMKRAAPADQYIMSANGGGWGTVQDIGFLRAHHLSVFRNQRVKID